MIARAARGAVIALLLCIAGSAVAQQADDAVTQNLEKSREAGLLTDWHLEGCFGHSAAEFDHHWRPEKEAVRPGRRETRHYELVFPEGRFVLPGMMSGAKGVLYASSNTYLTGGGDWNVFLESGGAAVVFVDGQKAVASTGQEQGVRRARVRLTSGYHTVLVKFTAAAAPFRVAVLPLNSGSRRKNNTPYLQASPAAEDLLAAARGPQPLR